VNERGSGGGEATPAGLLLDALQHVDQHLGRAQIGARSGKGRFETLRAPPELVLVNPL
jgi:hypothetical protein